jgi:twitching motility protein PilT
MEIEPLLAQLVGAAGSDLHLKAGSPPRVRRDGLLHPVDHAHLGAEATERLALDLLPEA